MGSPLPTFDLRTAETVRTLAPPARTISAYTIIALTSLLPGKTGAQLPTSRPPQTRASGVTNTLLITVALSGHLETTFCPLCTE
jgi:hypothetical protein